MTICSAIRVPTFTMPLNVEMGASTFTIGAVTSIETLACTATAVAVSRMVQPRRA